MRLLRLTKLVVIGYSILICSCHKSEPIEAPYNTLLINCWTHSFEEEVSYPLRVYRPCNFQEWPASEYRETFILKNNFKATYLVRASNDANFFEDGTWKYNTDSKLLQISNKDEIIIIEYRVEEIQADKLVLKL